MSMNRYGVIAQRHWARWLPRQYAAISDSNAASMELPSSQSTSINSMVLLVTGSNCFGRIALRRGISPRR